MISHSLGEKMVIVFEDGIYAKIKWLIFRRKRNMWWSANYGL